MYKSRTCKEYEASSTGNYNANYIRMTLRQEYVLLTGDYKKAILLEFFIVQQKKNVEDQSPLEGRSSDKWLNISYHYISRNSLLGLNMSNIRRHINLLIASGWVQRKKDENSLLYQYKVDLEKIKEDVKKIIFSYGKSKSGKVCIF